VPDRARAYAEVSRVLRPGGRFVATTNAWTHLIELRELLGRFGVASAMSARLRHPDELDLESAAEEIAQAGFALTRVARRTSALEVRAVEPLLDYVRSMIDGPTPSGDALLPLARHVARQIELQGAFHVGIAAGMIEAVRT
jgi:SAM-dependent methyltransferase